MQLLYIIIVIRGKRHVKLNLSLDNALVIADMNSGKTMSSECYGRSCLKLLWHKFVQIKAHEIRIEGHRLHVASSGCHARIRSSIHLTPYTGLEKMNGKDNQLHVHVRYVNISSPHLQELTKLDLEEMGHACQPGLVTFLLS